MHFEPADFVSFTITILENNRIPGSRGIADPNSAIPSPPNIHINYSDSQIPFCEDYLYCDLDYPAEGGIDAYVQG